MATLQDLFTGGYDSALWNESTTAVITINEVNNQIEVVNTGSGGSAGLETKIAYDMSDGSEASISIEFSDRNAAIYLLPVSSLNTNPYSEANWYRIALAGGDYYAEKKVSGSITTVATAGHGALPQVLEIKFPATGDEVRFEVGGAEKGSIATFDFASRDMFIQIETFTDSNAQEVHFDTFNAVHQSVTGATITAEPSTAARGETGLTITGTDFGATQGTGTLFYNSIDITSSITSWGDTSIVFTMPAALASLYSATGYGLVVTADDATTDTSANVPFTPKSVDDYVVSAGTLVTDETSVYNGYTGQAPRVGQDITHTILTSVTSKTFNVNANGTWSLSAPVTVDETVDIFITDTDGTIGSTQTFTLSVGGGGSFAGGSAAQDAQLSKIKSGLSITGSLNDLEPAWVVSLGASITSLGAQQSWHEYWDEEGIGAGSFNDRAMKWLSSLGYSGCLNDRWAAYWRS